uniref:Ampulexin 1 n=1 Tax=Ampulex compressa TaxID=860918 RepID=AMPU1_AMPCP|nr:RecName: Full=Ampulexin 1; Short=Axn1; Flags: Precursor [Ampulex compressa]ARK19783.1 ampulexin 1 [Ampulex compressa]
MKAIMVLFYVMMLTIIASVSMVNGSPGKDDYVNPKEQLGYDILEKLRQKP